MSRLLSLAFTIIVLLPQFGVSDDGEWGNLRGRFVYDGNPPPTNHLHISKDTAAFGDTVEDESLTVNRQNRGIANVIIYLLPQKGGELNVHPSYAESAESKVTLAMRNGRFEPHVLLLRTTQIFVQSNADSVGHNANIAFIANAPM